MKPKTSIVSYRTTPYNRRRLGALARKKFKAAGVQIDTKKRDQVSHFMGTITDAIIDGRLKVPPTILKAA